jgi:hypothetical protein
MAMQPKRMAVAASHVTVTALARVMVMPSMTVRVIAVVLQPKMMAAAVLTQTVTALAPVMVKRR